MANNPKSIEAKIRQAISAWETIAPTKSFGGMTLAQFKSGLGPSLDTRATLAELNNQIMQVTNQRDEADQISLELIQRFVAGILADPTEGPNSSLIEAVGRVRKIERASGLHRAKKSGGSSSSSSPAS